VLESIQSRTLINQTNNIQTNNYIYIIVHKQVGKSKNTSVTNIASNLSCACCKVNHQVYHCEEFLKLSVEEKFKIVKKANLRINCLRSTAHQEKLCNSGTCRKVRNTILCYTHLIQTFQNNPYQIQKHQIKTTMFLFQYLHNVHHDTSHL